MSVFKKLLLIMAILSALTIGTVGCDTDEGTIGDTGEEIGEGVGEAGDEIGDAGEEAGDEIGDTMQ